MPAAQSGSASSTVLPEQISDSAQLWLVRHGATEWSESGRHTGVSEVELTALGEKQAAALADMLADVAPEFVLCSPRQRAQRTAELAGLRVDVVDDDLAEWNYGTYEGRTTAEIRKEVPDWTIWTYGAPGGETAAEISERADWVLARAAKHLDDGPVVLIGHGHFSRALGVRWIDLPIEHGASLLLGTAAPSLLGAQHGARAIVHWNLPNPAE
jgi:broad specificity phosphatase PhoE